MWRGVSSGDRLRPEIRHLRVRPCSGVRTCSGANGGLSESGGGACAAEPDIQGFARRDGLGGRACCYRTCWTDLSGKKREPAGASQPSSLPPDDGFGREGQTRRG